MTGKKNVLIGVLGFDPDLEIHTSDFFRLHVSYLDSDKIDHSLDAQYHSFKILPRKVNGKPRKIYAPMEGLKKVQRAIAKNILSHVAPHPAATAFFAGSSIAINARQHLGCLYLYKTDVSDFFPSIKKGVIQAALENRFPHLSQLAIYEIVRLTTYKDALPQGAPTSPHLANIVLHSFDERLALLCKRLGARYTRYADDIAVSAGDMDALLIVDGVIRTGLAELGLRQHLDKTRFWGPNDRKIVTGLDVSGESVRPPRKFRKKTSALVRMCEVYPSRSTISNWSRIMGYLAHWQGVAPEDRELEGLKRRLKKLEPRRKVIMVTTGDRGSIDFSLSEIPF